MSQRDKKGQEVSKKLHKTKQNTCKSLNGKYVYKRLIFFLYLWFRASCFIVVK